MNVDIATKIRTLRKEKNVSQEVLAQFLNVSFQAISKWETGVTCPDISLLPDIARFFGVTVDELLSVESLDEKRRFAEYESEASEMFQNGRYDEALGLWKQAYKEMPNNVKVKEMLMSSYYDCDKIKYCDNIIELASEIYHSDAPNYYKGQAINQAAVTYAKNGNPELAEKWALKSFQINHCQEVIMTQIYEGKDLLDTVEFFTRWAFYELFYMVCKIDADETVPIDAKAKLEKYKTLAALYETLYKGNMDDDASAKLDTMRKRIAVLEKKSQAMAAMTKQ